METAASLLERLCTAPDEAAWQRLDDLYRPLLRRWLRCDPTLGGDAEGLVQEVMSILVRELPGFRRQRTGSFRCWLREITSRRLQTYYRQRRRQPQSQGDRLDQLGDPNSALSRRWDEEHDRHVLTRLLHLIEPHFEDRTLTAFRRLVFEEATPLQVAAELGMTEHGVLLAKARVLGRLRKEAEGLLD
jgi:RNA polymerase sigma-70 factor (ECF subfamily)